jgi:hypothetical protein
VSVATDFVYNKARVAFGNAQISWPTSNVKAMLVSQLYTPSPATDQYVSDVPSGAIIVRDLVCTNIGISPLGICYCTIAQVQSVSSPVEVAAMILYLSTGVDSTSPLIYFTSTGIGFPFYLQGFNYYIGYDQTANGWFTV